MRRDGGARGIVGLLGLGRGRLRSWAIGGRGLCIRFRGEARGGEDGGRVEGTWPIGRSSSTSHYGIFSGYRYLYLSFVLSKARDTLAGPGWFLLLRFLFGLFVLYFGIYGLVGWASRSLVCSRCLGWLFQFPFIFLLYYLHVI